MRSLETLPGRFLGGIRGTGAVLVIPAVPIVSRQRVGRKVVARRESDAPQNGRVGRHERHLPRDVLVVPIVVAKEDLCCMVYGVLCGDLGASMKQ